jgi:hypothetical protein
MPPSELKGSEPEMAWCYDYVFEEQYLRSKAGLHNMQRNFMS